MSSSLPNLYSTLSSSYQKSSNDSDDERPRKRIRQRVDAGLPRNTYSKSLYSNSSNALMSSTAKHLEGENSSQYQNNNHQMFQSYFSSTPYLQTLFRLQQLRQHYIQQSFLNDNLSTNRRLLGPEEAAEGENEYEVSKKRLKLNEESQSETTARAMNFSDVSSVNEPTDNENDNNETDSSVVTCENPTSDKPSEEISKSDQVTDELKDLAVKLKSELMQSLSDAVDKIVTQYMDDERIGLVTRPTTTVATPPLIAPPSMLLPTPQPSPYQSIFPYQASGAMACLNILANNNNNPQNSDTHTPLSLLLGRKRRTKVTDTRVNRLSLKQDESPLNFSRFNFGYPTMVPNQTLIPSWKGDDIEIGSSCSPENNSDVNMFESNTLQSTTLTPMHLRKAKLIFFYARYPTSAMLKAFFPDIRFHKNNTAQLVKWFSNFREFFYIQMEKYARQALAEGVKNAEDIVITVECDLYKCLTQHYNRNNNHVQIPATFCNVIESTLREFFLALQNNRDVEPAWKKTIYKIIARLDEPIPEYYKTTNFLEQLQ